MKDRVQMREVLPNPETDLLILVHRDSTGAPVSVSGPANARDEMIIGFVKQLGYHAIIHDVVVVEDYVEFVLGEVQPLEEVDPNTPPPLRSPTSEWAMRQTKNTLRRVSKALTWISEKL